MKRSRFQWRQRILSFALGILFALGFGSDLLQARSLDEIVEDGILRVAVKGNLPPLGFLDPNGQLVGFEIDIARELARRLLGSSDAVELIPTANQDRLAVLISDQVDLVIAQMGVTSTRAREVSFSRPYYLDGIGIVVRADSPIQRWADLHNRRIVALAGSEAVQRATLSLPTAEILTVGNYQDGLDLLTLQAVEAVVADISVLAGWLRSNPGYRLLDPPLSSSGLAVVTAKGTDRIQLSRWVAQEIETLRSSGWLQERTEAWDLP